MKLEDVGNKTIKEVLEQMEKEVNTSSSMDTRVAKKMHDLMVSETKDTHKLIEVLRTFMNTAVANLSTAVKPEQNPEEWITKFYAALCAETIALRREGMKNPLMMILMKLKKGANK